MRRDQNPIEKCLYTRRHVYIIYYTSVHSLLVMRTTGLSGSGRNRLSGGGQRLISSTTNRAIFDQIAEYVRRSGVTSKIGPAIEIFNDHFSTVYII